MDRPNYPEDEKPGTTNTVPALIHDYRAQRDAWREQARNLARMREEVLAAADREARDIVTAARADVRQILLKARRDLLVLAAQVRAAGRLGDGEDPPDTVNFLPADDLGNARDALTTARNNVRRVLDESRPELDGLAAEGDALRAALRQHRPPAPAPVDVRRHISAPPVLDAPDDRLSETVEYEYDDSPDLILTHDRHPVRASIGAVALMGTGWWLFRSPSNAGASTVASSKPSSGSKAPTVPTTRAANTAAPAVRTADNLQRSPLSIQLAARRPTWIRVTTDGRVTAERIFKPGETQQIRATRNASIRAGDAGAVTVSVDGRQPVALGREGETLTRQFAVETPPAPRPAPVARPTPSPAVPVAQSTPQRPPATPAASLSNTTVLSSTPAPAPAPRVTEQPPVTPPPTVSAGGPPAAAPSPSSLPPRPAAASVDRPAATAPPASAAVQTSLQDSLTSIASRWLDAYYRQDRATMAAISTQVTIDDDRGEKERMPRGLLGVRRSLDDVNFRVFETSADRKEAMLTARMTERMENTAASQMAVSYVSHMWTQRNGAWQLHSVRIVSASALSRAVSR
jgi:hypothetical protein